MGLRFALAALCAATAFGGAAQARPYTLDDHLAREGLGQVALAADGRRLVWERRGPYRSGARFDHDRFNDLFRTRLEVVELDRPSLPRTLGEAAPGAGYALGPLSPDGASAAVYELLADRWRLGVGALADGRVRWFDLTSEISEFGETVLWRSPTELLLITAPEGKLPFALRWGRPQAALPERWRQAAQGEASVTVLGSGRYFGLRPRDPPKRLLRLDLVSGQARRLAQGDFTDMALSPDGRTLALLEAGADIPLSAGTPVQGSHGVATRRMRLRLVDLATGAVRAAPQGWDVLAHLLAWSPDSAEVLVFARTGGAWTQGRLLRVEARTGRARPLPPPGGEVILRRRPEAVRAAWAGGRPAVLVREADGRLDWRGWTGRRWRSLTGELPAPAPEAALVAGRLVVVAGGAAWSVAASGRARRLGGGASLARFGASGVPRRQDVAVATQAATLIVTGPDVREALHMTSDGAHRLGALAQDESPLAAGPGGMLVRRMTGGGQETLIWAGPDGRRELARLNAHLEPVQGPTLCAVRHEGPDGAALTSWLALPDAFGPARPLVVWPYPGRVYGEAAPAALDPARALENPTPLLIAAHGYAVLLPSLPASSAEGPAEGLAGEILKVVAAAEAAPCARGRIDAARLGLWGHSFGGYAALAAAGQTGRFAAIVAAAAPSDLAGAHGAFGPNRRVAPEEGLATPWTAGWVESLQGAMGAPPWAAPDRYVRNSPLFAAGAIETPILILHGELDGFPLEQAERMFAALYRQGKDAQLVTYWGEAHTLRAPGAIVDAHRRALAFLDAHLLDRR